MEGAINEQEIKELANNFAEAFIDVGNSIQELVTAVRSATDSILVQYLTTFTIAEFVAYEKLTNASFITRWYYRRKYRKLKLKRIKMERIYNEHKNK